jgi:hypothetical protein
VSFTARLVRAPGVQYTEVDGTPVVVAVEDLAVQPLSPVWAAAWATLDGRSVAEALELDPDALEPVTRRDVIEVLRRLKAARLVCDAASIGTSGVTPFGDDDLHQSTAVHAEMSFLGSTTAQSEAGGVRLVVDPGGEEVVTVTLHDTSDGCSAVVEGTSVDEVVVVDPTPDAVQGPTEPSVAALTQLVAAILDAADLRPPGAVDLLAALAERAVLVPA